MIVGRDPGRLALVRQVDHQDQCGLIAVAWGNDAFARPEPWGPLVDAAYRHDEGWREWDDAPEVDATGAPVDFPDLDRPTHMAFYRRGIEAAVAHDTRCGLVVCMHGRGLYEKRLGLDGPPPARAARPPEEREFIEDQERLQHALERRVGGDVAAWGWAGFRLLQAWDVISLYLTWRGVRGGTEWLLPQVPRRTGDAGVPIRVRPAGEDACTLDPWPFAADRVELPVRRRVIPDRPHRDDADLRAALAAAEWETLPAAAVRT